MGQLSQSEGVDDIGEDESYRDEQLLRATGYRLQRDGVEGVHVAGVHFPYKRCSRVWLKEAAVVIGEQHRRTHQPGFDSRVAEGPCVTHCTAPRKP